MEAMILSLKPYLAVFCGNWVSISARLSTVFHAHIWASEIWSIRVSLKRSSKMQLKCIDLRSKDPQSKAKGKSNVDAISPL